MKTPLLCLLLTLVGGVFPSEAAYYQAGQVVTNFTIYTRRAWSDSAGRTFAPGAPIRLSDFAGKVIFVEFFDPT
jgi:hypothetical protein